MLKDIDLINELEKAYKDSDRLYLALLSSHKTYPTREGARALVLHEKQIKRRKVILDET